VDSSASSDLVFRRGAFLAHRPGETKVEVRHRSRCPAIVLAIWVLASAASACAAVPTSDEIKGLIRSGQYVQAEKLARALVADEQRLHGPESLERARAIDLLVTSVRLTGKGGTSEADSLCKLAIGLKEKALGSDDPETANSVSILGVLFLERGDYSVARRHLERALEIRKLALGPAHPDVARSLRYLAVLESAEGNSGSAISLAEQSLAILRAKLSPDDPELADALDALAGFLYNRGDYADAGPLYEQALAIYLRAFGQNHPKVATIHHNLGAVCSELEENEDSRRNLTQALAIRRRLLGSNHPLVASTLTSLATTLEKLGDISGARIRYEEALHIERRAYGGRTNDFAWTLMRLGRIDARLGNYARAKRRLNEALEIQREAIGPENPDIAWTLPALAVVEEAEGDTSSARKSYLQAAAIVERRYGPAHPDLIHVLNDYAAFLARWGDSTAALDVALRSAAARNAQLRSVSRGLAERQALAYTRFGSRGLSLALALAGKSTTEDGARRAWDILIRSRTLVLDEMAMRQELAASASADAGLAPAAHAVEAARRRYANLLVRGPAGNEGQSFSDLLDRAREEVERAERGLAARSKAFQAGEARGRSGWSEISAGIPSDAALVAFALSDSGGLRSYVALVARAGEPPRVIPLGGTDQIDALINRWAETIVSAPSADAGPEARRSETSCRKAGLALRRRIWDPVGAVVGHPARVLIVPDGALYRVSFAALPDGNSNYLVDTGPLFHTITSERDLVPAPGRQPLGKGLLALGGPAFDGSEEGGPRVDEARTRGAELVSESPSENLENIPRGPEPDCPDFRQARFEPLPESAQEVQDLGSAWEDSASALVLTGAAATEAAFKRSAPGKRVLHLATHGFFIDASHCALVRGRRLIGGVSMKHETPIVVGPSGARASHGNPLLLSGLALSGANRRSEAGPNDEDGILTAQEVASLDLGSVDWAVLSACDTGVGSVQAGEGVLGLRRAFQIAGARTVIMSLWSVDDRATRRWMGALYEGKYRRGLSTAEAVREASRSVLREQRAQKRSTHPFFWAGFVAAGDWR
jgi:CHAT domain-containing protein/tetratricopeptide (TPR) repeat protein